MADNAYDRRRAERSATRRRVERRLGGRRPRPIGDAAPRRRAEKKWYIVHTYSGHENKAKLTLLERVRNANLNEFFGDVLVPTESVTEVVKGQRRTMTRKFFPGYMFVQMVLDDRTFHLVKNTPKITGFLGGTKPTPVPEREITGVQTNMTEGKAKTKARVIFEPETRSASSMVRSRTSRPRSRRSRPTSRSSRSRCRCSAAPRRSSLTSPRSRKHKPAPPVRRGH